jgi:hypothetical protein
MLTAVVNVKTADGKMLPAKGLLDSAFQLSFVTEKVGSLCKQMLSSICWHRQYGNHLCCFYLRRRCVP